MKNQLKLKEIQLFHSVTWLNMYRGLTSPQMTKPHSKTIARPVE